jgi:hypothetical protein
MCLASHIAARAEIGFRACSTTNYSSFQLDEIQVGTQEKPESLGEICITLNN